MFSIHGGMTVDSLLCYSCVCRGQVSKSFNLSTATSFDDPRLTLVHEDAAEFVKKEVRTRISFDTAAGVGYLQCKSD